MECINMFLLKDGINLGGLSLEIHDAVQQVVYRCWLTTHDRGLKVIFFGNYGFVLLDTVMS